MGSGMGMGPNTKYWDASLSSSWPHSEISNPGLLACACSAINFCSKSAGATLDIDLARLGLGLGFHGAWEWGAWSVDLGRQFHLLPDTVTYIICMRRTGFFAPTVPRASWNGIWHYAMEWNGLVSASSFAAAAMGEWTIRVSQDL